MPEMVQSSQALAGAMPQGIIAYLRGESKLLSDLECELLVAVGAQAYRAERYDEAAAMFRANVLARPNSSRAWCLLAMCHDAVEDQERAVALYEIAALAPDQEGLRTKISVYRARALCVLDRIDEAANTLEALEDTELDAELDAIRSEVSRTIDEETRR